MTADLLAPLRAAAQIQTYDDRVMGGVSCSHTAWVDNVLQFSGSVSLEHNGGFCSSRYTIPELAFSEFSGVLICARGTPRSFALRLFHERHNSTYAYQTEFTPTEQWCDFKLSLTSFTPRFRGKAYPSAPPLGSRKLCAVGLLTGNREPGEFRLECRSLELI